ncbi:MAG: segregation/condensation protein A [Eubacteriaceae bacterium]|nr:segregation/condensation protein A [Eubacteriaceae bacterium]MBR0383670.1 segregation/condensation protein A [Eubacteriaceae bacterium]
MAEALTVSIDAFEGPFDLLLHLIAKHRIDICDVAIAQITGQYLATIRHWQSMNTEVAGEFIVMASTLLEIKSKSLLPKREESIEETEEIDLVARLRLYKAFKAVSEELGEKLELERGALYKEGEYLPSCEPKPTVDDIDTGKLGKLFGKILRNYVSDHTYKAPPITVVSDPYTIEGQTERIRTILAESGEAFPFEAVLKAYQRGEIAVSFQALLELYKTGNIETEQRKNFGKILIFKKGSNHDENPQTTDNHPEL